MTGNMSYLTDLEEIDGGYVAFGVPRKNNMYSVDLKNIVPKRGLTCLFAKATSDESKLWHRRLGHINFKTMNKLVRGNLVRGLPSKLFKENQTSVACQNGKQHRASSRTPQQNGVAKRKNRTLIEAARTMLVDSKLPTTFWAEAVNTAYYVQNRFDGTKACDDAGKARMETIPNKDYILLPLWTADPPFSQSLREPRKEGGDSSNDQEKEDDNVNNTNNVNIASDGNNTNNVNVVSLTVNTAGIEVNTVSNNTSIELPNDPNMPELEYIMYSGDYEDVGVEADMNNLDAFMLVSPIQTTRIHKDHPVEQIIGDLNSTPQTRRMTKNLKEHGLWDATSAFLYVRLKWKSYVFVTTRIEDPYFPDKVYKVEKVLYGLHQAPRAWYETLSTYLLNNRFQRGKINKTLFIQNTKSVPVQDNQAYTDSDYAGASLDRKSTTGGCQFLGSKIISWQCKKQTVVANSATKAEYVAASINAARHNLLLLLKVNAARHNLLLLLKVNAARHNLLLLLKVNAARHKLTTAATTKVKIVNEEVQLQALVDGKKIIVTKASVRHDLQLNDEEGTDCLPNATIFEELTRMGAKTTAWNEFSSTMASAITCLATNQKFNFSKYIFKSMVKNLDNAGKFLMYPRRPKRKDTEVPQSSGPIDNVADKAVNEEMDDNLVRAATTASSLEAEVLDLENTKTAQAQEITSLKLRVKKLEKKGGSRTHKLKILYKGRKINDIDKDAEITLVHKTQGRYGDEEMFDTYVLDGDEVLAEPEVPVKYVNLSVDEVTLAQALAVLKSAKVQEKANVVKEPSESITTTPTLTTTTAATTITVVSTRPKAKGLDKGKGKMEEPEKPIKKKELIRLDEEIASKLQAEFDEEVRLAREKAKKEEEANIVAWDNVQAMIDADYQMA
ncbi:putative ribonuclease H-like domain-containing protein [Tanacetum coccineum]|uniref:Ribonuclease H-like domain-containing protein n=1 Tax=Tanacetum coccineum TaxID=301880 RepID=A0ABQ4YQI5_9ASTR